MVALRQNGVGASKTSADAILPKGHQQEAGNDRIAAAAFNRKRRVAMVLLLLLPKPLG
jgi:hypothetical protein